MDVQSALFISFVLAAATMCVTPGPDMLYVMSYGVSQGRAGGVAAAAGVAAGMLVHAVLSAFGVALLISQYPWLMMIFKGIGICYLVYLGLSIIRDKSDMAVDAKRAQRSYARIAYKAMMVNLMNPKVVVFYVAFLPQFTSPSGWPVPAQLFTLGVVFVTLGFAADATVGLASGALGKKFAENGTLTRKVNVSCGIVMFLLAAVLLLDI
ncbi:LysE family translocator [Streptomyces sp. NPDC060022]|uniref:LysE family translocator n=1 Tax=Streptomyces sp. NPDC060022 TaxID=3347039 RepID=UPI0036BC3DC7